MTQDEVLLKFAPYVIAVLGGTGGVWAFVKGIAAFRDWLIETRRRVEEVPQRIEDARRATDAFARDAARSSTAVLKVDVDNLGTKVGLVEKQQARDGDRMTRTEHDLEKLTAEFRAAEKALPETLKNERHAMNDGPLNNLSLRLDELKEDVKDMQRKGGGE